MTDAPMLDLQDAYQRPAGEVVAALSSDVQRGLASSEARARLEQYGPNTLQTAPPVPAWQRFLAQFRDALVILLLIATAVSAGVWLYERDTALPYEAIAILTIVLLNGILGFVQEERAEKSLAALRAMSAATAVVLRDGERQQIAAADLVPGDLLLVEEGDTISADARLLSATALQTAEAALTGESLPINKDTAPISGEAGPGDRVNTIFSGTVVTYGRGTAIVTATGMQTEMGRVAGLLEHAHDPPTPLQQELDRLGKVLGGVVIVIAVVIIATILLVQQVSSVSAMVDVLILGVALAVAAVPEGLVAIVTMVLAIGVQQMVRRNAIIRKLAAVETLGSANVIATDKTGTLTRNEMTVRTVVTASGRVDFEGIGYTPEGRMMHEGRELTDEGLRAEVEKTLRAAELANNARLSHQDERWAVLGDPTEGALLVAARKAGLSEQQLETRFARVNEVPFSSERKRMSTIHEDAEKPERVVIFSKGAPDVLLARCNHERIGEEVRPLTEERCAEIRAAVDQLASEALRTLGMAFRTLPHESLDGNADDQLEHELVFLGLVGMIDPPRPEARDAVQTARRAGIRTVMITGDHPRTAAAIAADLGIIQAGERVVVGAELQAMDDAQLETTVRDVSVYARVSPEHKLRIVQAMQRNGAVVAMTGDGVNDAPALKTANIGVAMGITGTDVSKEAADMVLTDDNFASIVAAVEEGRTIFANIQKFLRFLISSNVGEVLTMFLGVVLAGMIGLTAEADEVVLLPLLATQILWINLVTDGAPALALGLDPTDSDVMAHPPRSQASGVITAAMWRGIVLVGVVMAAGTLFILDASLPGGLIAGTGNLAHARTLAFTTLIFFQLFNVLNARSDTQSAFHGLLRNGWLWAAIGVSIVLHLLVVYAPILQAAFATVPLSIGDWLLCTAVGSTVLWIRELSKLATRARMTA